MGTMNRSAAPGSTSPSKRFSPDTSPLAAPSPRHKIVHHAGPSIELQLKEAFAGVIKDIRGEVARAVSTLRDEVVMGARMASLKEDAEALKQRKAHPQNMAEHLQQSEKEALGREFLKAANTELAGRMDYLEGLHQLMSQKLQDQWEQASRDLQQQLDGGLEILAARLERSGELVREELRAMQSELCQETQAILVEVHRAQEEEAAHHFAVSEQLKDGLDELDKQTNRRLVATKAELTDRLGEVRQGTKDALTGLGHDVLQNHQRCEELIEELDVKIEQGQGSYKDVVKWVANSIEEETRKQGSSVQTSMKTMLTELSRIQQALNIEYVRIKTPQSWLQPPSPTGGPAALMAEPASFQRSASPESSGSSKPRRSVRAKTVTAGPRTGFIMSPISVISTRGEQSDSSSAAQDLVTTLSMTIPGMSHNRVRDSGSQTEALNQTHREGFAQTDPIQLEQAHKKKNREKNTLDVEKEKKAQRALERLNGAEALKKKAKQASMKPPYNVMDYYHDDGFAQRIAKHPRFDNASLAMVVVNALWIAVDTDGNNEALLVNAHPIFIFAENFFCSFFLGEIAVRFCAFKHKINCLKDGWFLFDAALVIIAVLETWILQAILVAVQASKAFPSGASSIKMIRLVRLFRLTRMTRLLRAVPELMIVLKGLAFAFRSVSVFFVLWLLIIYMSAILLRQLTEPTVTGKVDLSSVPAVMNMLLLNGVFPTSEDFITQMTALDWGLWIIIVPFMALVSLTIMYMLVGVLVEVISVVASSEKERLAVALIANGLRKELVKLGRTEETPISQAEFSDIMMEPGVIRIAQEAGVDIAAMADMLDLIFEDIAKSAEGSIGFSDLVDLMLNMRGTNPATVKDCKEQIRVTKAVFRKCFDELTADLTQQLKAIQSDIQESLYDRDDMEDFM
eukprot:TRINITY_DN245_c0_g1_i1.p1 TRINITY_DN245_c0_g1~~TRINITY_DN245_c0_g1_i1.p1  ORF type:complete len:910 (+),score=210.11 TRINITY_DN245_c0_g1_i1:83-2812(+)